MSAADNMDDITFPAEDLKEWQTSATEGDRFIFGLLFADNHTVTKSNLNQADEMCARMPGNQFAAFIRAQFREAERVQASMSIDAKLADAIIVLSTARAVLSEQSVAITLLHANERNLKEELTKLKAKQAAPLEPCPDGCYRPKARNADDCRAGCCSKWYAVNDDIAKAECYNLASYWQAKSPHTIQL